MRIILRKAGTSDTAPKIVKEGTDTIVEASATSALVYAMLARELDIRVPDRLMNLVEASIKGVAHLQELHPTANEALQVAAIEGNASENKWAARDRLMDLTTVAHEVAIFIDLVIQNDKAALAVGRIYLARTSR